MEPQQAQILDGKLVAEHTLQKIMHEVEGLKSKNICPKLSIILVGENPASISYIRQKRKSCEKVGIIDDQINFSETISEKELLNKIKELNKDNSVHGILVQLPLPKHINEREIIEAINPVKDVDGFHPVNIGKMFLGKDYEELSPCTPSGIIKILEYYKIDVVGKEITIVGRSNIVGKPVSTMLTNRSATVTTCHSKTKDLKFHTSRADILIVAIGRANFITADMVKEGAIVIDVGMNRVEDPNSKTNYRLTGDVDFENIVKKAKAITPAPGGCGPMTVACLIENTIKATKILNSII